MIPQADWLQAALDWLAKLAPGDLATWFTGIVTAGSLWLGFSIVRRDHLKEAQRPARQIGAWLNLLLPDGDTPHVTGQIFVYNSSPNVIVAPEYALQPLSSLAIRLTGGGKLLKHFRAQSQQDTKLAKYLGPRGRPYRLSATVTDAEDRPMYNYKLNPEQDALLKQDLLLPPTWYIHYFTFIDASGNIWRVRMRDRKLRRFKGGTRHRIRRWFLERVLS